MESERDIITNGLERRGARLRWAGPVAAGALLAAAAVFVATRPDGAAEPAAAPPTTNASRTTTSPAKLPPTFAPPPQPDNRPEASAPQRLYADAQRALVPTGQAGVAMIELIGSDYRRGEVAFDVFGQRMPGTMNVDLVCVGTGTTRVWIQGQNGESIAGPPVVLDCANPQPARLTSTNGAAGFTMYANPDPNTVAVLAYVAIATVEIE
jgi:hypothetical protein